MKKVYDFLISMKFMIFLVAIFAIACAEATFIENDHGTSTAWAEVYGTRWFELIQLLLAINLIGNIFKFKMFKKDKLTMLTFHIGFLVVLLASALTRYYGFEGMMHIREGGTSNTITTLKSYVQIQAREDGEIFYKDLPLTISKISPNDFTMELDTKEDKATLTYTKLIPNSEYDLVEDNLSNPVIKMMVADGNEKAKVIFLDSHTNYDAKDFILTLNSDKPSTKSKISIKVIDKKFFITSDADINYTNMSDGSTSSIKKDDSQPFELKRMYDFGTFKLTPIKTLISAKRTLVSKKDKKLKSAIKATLSYKGETKNITLFGHGGSALGVPAKTTIKGTNFIISWGAKTVSIPYQVKLKKFELKRYPGSMSPSSYASYVTLIDKENDVIVDYHIFMNHVLDYKDYRFFQSSYDTDEKGTILSVNNDPGKLLTYIGYFLISLGFTLTLFNPKSRFRKLIKLVQKDTVLKSLALILLLSFSNTTLKASSLEVAASYDKTHAEHFGNLLLQKNDGRIISLDTFSNEILLKIAKTKSIHGLTSNQIILGMMTSPQLWQDIPLILVKHDKIKRLLGLSPDAKYASYDDFFDFTNKTSPYKLSAELEKTHQISPVKRNTYDRKLIKVDERLNITYMIYTGTLLKIIPKLDDKNQKWYNIKEAIDSFKKEESTRIRTLFLYYFSQIEEAKKSENWGNADKAVKLIRMYQNKIGADIIPSEQKLQVEKTFKEIGLFNKLSLVYLIGGMILLFAIFTKMVRSGANLSRAFTTGQTIIFLAFAIHTIGMGVRWYIGGHAPWSNSYEAMLYISWSMGLAGLVFARYSILAPALTALIASSVLLTTMLTEMDPQITNLVPVLKSYWLNIHVSILTASYGFLGLSMILGFFTLILFIFKNDTNKAINKSIIEATRINEMTVIIGLVMLTIGTFLGGVWANESWGRYWSWDPKETWSWISVLVYVILSHMRFIPALNKNYNYNFAALSLISYASIIMTFVGVNYYLSGMHSYAAGDPMPIPKYLYLIIAIVVIVIAIAYKKRSLKAK